MHLVEALVVRRIDFTPFCHMMCILAYLHSFYNTAYA